MKKKVTYGQRLAIIIMTAHEMDYEVSMLQEAEGIIKQGRSIDVFEIGWFEKCAADAHEKIKSMGEAAVVKANAIGKRLIDEFL